MEKQKKTWTAVEIGDGQERQRIARKILESLRDWFEITRTREAYIRESGEQAMLAVREGTEEVGFLCLKETGSAAAEVSVMGVLREYHRQGVGRALMEAAGKWAEHRGYDLLQVKTVEMGRYEDYDRTNLFYLGMGFKTFEVFPELWDKDNPCQVYVMPLHGNARFLDVISARRSYRGRYRGDRVPREDLERIMRAGLDAPSGCNRQTTSLLAVDDPDTLKKLRGVIQPPAGETAPAMICVLCRRIIAYRDRCFAVQDYAAAIENMLLAITALGYASCWYEGHITDTDRIGDRMAEILHVPGDYELVCFLPVGIAEEEATRPVRKPFEERAFFNRFPEGKN